MCRSVDTGEAITGALFVIATAGDEPVLKILAYHFLDLHRHCRGTHSRMAHGMYVGKVELR